MFEAVIDTVKICSMMFIIITGAMIFTRFMSVSGSIESIINIVLGLSLTPNVILWTIILIWLIMGIFMEVVGILTLTIPVFYPILMSTVHENLSENEKIDLTLIRYCAYDIRKRVNLKQLCRNVFLS